ncbi:hypothetical protein DBR06_SOUSAS3810066, partial [Sousa chinensis]
FAFRLGGSDAPVIDCGSCGHQPSGSTCGQAWEAESRVSVSCQVSPGSCFGRRAVDIISARFPSALAGREILFPRGEELIKDIVNVNYFASALNFFIIHPSVHSSIHPSIHPPTRSLLHQIQLQPSDAVNKPSSCEFYPTCPQRSIGLLRHH